MSSAGFKPPKPSKRAAADTDFIPRGHWDRLYIIDFVYVFVGKFLNNLP